MPREKPTVKKRQMKRQVNFRLDLKTYETLKKLAAAAEQTRTDVIISLIKRALK